SALGTVAGRRVVRVPATTIALVVLSLRPTAQAFRDPKVRQALLESIDRGAIVETAFGGLASRADSLVPPSSWAFDAAASPFVKLAPRAAANALTAAPWTRAKDGWRAPRSKAAMSAVLTILT